jgi:hypothetical protein
MKPTLIKICLFLTFGVLPFTEILSQLTLTTVNDPLLGSTKIKGISQNQLGETLLLSGKKIYTFVDQVTDVFTCSPCNDIRDVAMVGDTMFIACDGSGIVKRFGDSTKVVTSLRADRLVSGNGGKLYGVDWMDGLDYWDGSTWTNLKTSNSNIPTNNIYDVVLDHNGLLWIASQIGLISWNGTTFSLKSIPSDLSETFYDVNVDADNAIWVASAFGGVGKYNGSTWTTFSSTFNAAERVENLAVLHGSEIWTSETSLGFYRYTGTFNTVPFASLGATEWYTNDVLYGDAQNRLWIQNQFTALRYLTTEPSATSGPSVVDQSINIYPNPALDLIKIESIDKDVFITDLTVYSVDGMLILNQPLNHQNQAELQVMDWQSGMYFIKIKTNEGICVKKLNKL